MKINTDIFKDIEITLGNITIITGVNGSGKSRLLDAIYSQLRKIEELVLFYAVDAWSPYSEGEFISYMAWHYEEDLFNIVIPKFLPSIKKLRIENNNLVIDKDNLTIWFYKLSKGEDRLVTLLADIIVKLNQTNPLLTEATILIDEIELHLHPSVQVNICSLLRTTFPNCKFILTTNSPLILNNEEDILVYKLEEGKIHQVESQYGQDANTVLLEVFNTNHRNEAIQIQLNDLLDLIQDNKLDEAKGLIKELKEKLSPNNIELIKANLLLKKQQLR